MFKKVMNAALGALVLGIAFSALPAHAQLVQFASFLNLSANNFKYDNATGNLFSTLDGTTPGAIPILFVYAQGTGMGAANTPISATMTFTATSLGIATGAPTADQALTNVQMSITANTPGVFGSNLLSLTTGTTGDILATTGSNQTTVRGDTSLADVVTFSSDYLDFSNTGQRVYSFTTTNTTPPFSIGGNGRPNDFTATYGGNFSSNPMPVSKAVPEANAALLLGLALPLVGGMIVRRRK